MKQCPYCGEDIEESAKKCKYCNEWLEEINFSFSSLNWKKIISPDMLKIVKIALFFALFVGLLVLGYNEYQSQNGVEEVTYRSITPIENSEHLANRYSARGVLELIIRQEQDLKDYLSGNHSRAQKTGLFMLYYKNLQLLVEAFPMELPELWEYDTSDKVLRYLNSYGIKFQPYFINNFYREQDRISYLTFEQPKINLFEIIYVGEGFYGFAINDGYITDSYAKYLNKSWQDYMNNKKQVYKDLGHESYYIDGSVIPDGLTVAKWTVMWEKFIRKYPNFELKDKVYEDIKRYGSDILYRKYFTTYDEKTQKEFLSEDLREGCKYYIKNGDKTTKLYKKLKQDYDLWEKNNFEYKKIEDNYRNSPPED